MVERFVSAPIMLAPDASKLEYARADLVFYGVDHSGASFEARIFVNLVDATAATPREHPNYAGSFNVFGHGGCFGDVGHCDVPTGPRDPFDWRPQHPLTPAVKTVIVTDALRRIAKPEDASITVTAVAIVIGTAANAVLQFDTVRLLTYR
jgi:tyrosinase